MNDNKPILLVEDDKVDAMTVKRALKELNVKNKLVITENGEIALEYLLDEDNENPCFILLDLNMPRMNGIEFLEIVKNDSVLKSIPVIVLTTSKADQDRRDSYKHSVAGYIIKPLDYDKFVESIDIIKKYWTLSEFP